MNKGFTLIELLVVVLIIGILAAIAVPQYQKAVEKSRVTEMLSTIRSIKTCFEWYQLEHGLPSGNDERIHVKDMNCPIEINMGELNENNSYETENSEWLYAECNKNGCRIEVRRNLPNDLYSLEVNRDGTQRCATQLTTLGRSVCKSIENQGWTYYDGEL